MNFKSFSTFVISATILCLSQSAFAIHAYRSLECKSSDFEFSYKGNYLLGGDYAIKRIGSEAEFIALPLQVEGSENNEQNTLANAEVIFTVPYSTTLGEKTKTSECYFDHEAWRSRKHISIKMISASAAESLGLSVGKTIKVNCTESTDIPNGKECDN